mgnify:CR=1 FL=1
MSGCEITEKSQNNNVLRVRFMGQHFWHNIISGSVVNCEERVIDLW